MDMKQQAMLKRNGKRLLGSAFGAFLYAAGTNLFVVPSGMYTGGLMGICQMIRTFLVDILQLPLANFDIAGIIYYLFNIPLFFIAYKRLGKSFVIRTAINVTLMTVFFSIIPIVPVLDDLLAAAIIGGILCGIAIGITLFFSTSTGGMDVIGMLAIQWRKDFSVGKISLFVNVVVYGLCLFLFDIQRVIYSMIFSATYSAAVDKMHQQNINVEVTIITKNDSKQLENEIMKGLERGITKWEARGAYTEDETNILYILLSKYEVNRLKTIVHKYDPHAFIVVNEGVRVDGNYLKKLT